MWLSAKMLELAAVASSTFWTSTKSSKNRYLERGAYGVSKLNLAMCISTVKSPEQHTPTRQECGLPVSTSWNTQHRVSHRGPVPVPAHSGLLWHYVVSFFYISLDTWV